MTGVYDQLIKNAYDKHLAKYGMTWELLKCMYHVESSLQPDVVSDKGAQGIAQFMPDTWAEWGEGDPLDPEASIDAGARYLAWLLSQWRSQPRTEMDRWKLSIASYNCGLGHVLDAQALSGGKLAYNQIVPAYLDQVTGNESIETINHVKRVFTEYCLEIAR